MPSENDVTLRGATPYADRFLTGQKSALLAFAVPADRVQVEPGAPWQRRDEVFQPGQQVHSVSHSGLSTSTQGGTCSIRALPSKRRIDLQITRITMVDCAQLTDQQIADLGLSLDEFHVLYGHLTTGLKGWLIYAIPIAPGAALQ
jgi:hypothetical protein